MIKIAKSRIPIMWLDTSIMLKLTRYLHNPDKLHQPDRERISHLYSLLVPAVNNNRLIIPICEQAQEVVGEDRQREWFNAMQHITLGIMSLSDFEIEQLQLRVGMTEYLESSGSLSFSYSDIFDQDPVEESAEVIGRGLVINPVTIPGAHNAVTKWVKNEKLKLWNNERERNLQEAIGFDQLLQKIFQKKIDMLDSSGQDGLIELPNITEISMWNSLDTKNSGLDGLKLYYQSDYYRKLPFVDIKSKLSARIKTRSVEIKSGDLMDIDHAAIVMPFSNIYITDKKFCPILTSEGFDKKYETIITHLGDQKQINNFFDNL